MQKADGWNTFKATFENTANTFLLKEHATTLEQNVIKKVDEDFQCLIDTTLVKIKERSSLIQKLIDANNPPKTKLF